MINIVLALALVPLSPVHAAAPVKCRTGMWRMSGYQAKGVSSVYNTSLSSKGGAGAKLKISASGFAWDFKNAAKIVTSGRTNGVKIYETALYRRILQHKVTVRTGRFTTKISSATGGALVKTVTTRPEKSSRLQKVAPLVRNETATIIPTGRVAFACTAHTLHFRRTIKLDGHGGRDITDWWFKR